MPNNVPMIEIICDDERPAILSSEVLIGLRGVGPCEFFGHRIIGKLRSHHERLVLQIDPVTV